MEFNGWLPTLIYFQEYPFKNAFAIDKTASGTDYNRKKGNLKMAYWIYLKYFRSRSPDNLTAKPAISFADFASHYTVSDYFILVPVYYFSDFTTTEII